MIKTKHFYYSIAYIFVIIIAAACNLSQADMTAIPTADIPQVEFLFPANNQQVVEGIVFDVEIAARDSAAGVAKIEFYVDDGLINSVSPVETETAPIFTARMNWRAQGVGLHVFEAIAYRLDGTHSDPAVITIEVLARDD